MAESKEPESPPGTKTRVTLVFDRGLSPEELRQLQASHDAIEAVFAEGDHDHDHAVRV